MPCVQTSLSVHPFFLLFLLIVHLSEIWYSVVKSELGFHLNKVCDLVIPFSIEKGIFQLPRRKDPKDYSGPKNGRWHFEGDRGSNGGRTKFVCFVKANKMARDFSAIQIPFAVFFLLFFWGGGGVRRVAVRMHLGQNPCSWTCWFRTKHIPEVRMTQIKVSRWRKGLWWLWWCFTWRRVWSTRSSCEYSPHF